MEFNVYCCVTRAAGIACGLFAALTLVGCNTKAAPALAVLSPQLDLDGPTVVLSPVETTNVAPIVQSTLDSQQKISTAAEHVMTQFANVDAEQASYFPQISVGIATDFIGSGAGNPQLLLNGSQMIYDFGRTGRDVTRQILLAQKTHLDFLDAVDKSLTEMLRLLVKFDSERRQLALGRDRLDRMTELRSLVESRSAEGVTVGNSLIEAERRVQTAKTLLLRSDLTFAGINRALEAETGMAVSAIGAGVDTSGLNCGSIPLDESMVTTVKKGQVDIAIAQLNLENTQTQKLPKLSLEVSAGGDLPTLSDSSDVGIRLNVDTALFSGGAFGARITAAERRLAAAQATLNAEREDVQRDHAEVIDTIATQKIIVQALKEQSDLLDQTRTIYLQQFIELGTKTIDDILDVEEDYHQTLLDIEITQLELAVEQINCLASQGLSRRFLGVEDKLLHGLILHQ